MNQKQLIAQFGPRGNQQQKTVTLNGFVSTEALTPAMARRAARIACGHCHGVTVWDLEFGHGYRIYQNSARKLSRRKNGE